MFFEYVFMMNHAQDEVKERSGRVVRALSSERGVPEEEVLASYLDGVDLPVSARHRQPPVRVEQASHG